MAAAVTDLTVAAHPSDNSKQRADIQGLRAIAVILVLFFHLWPNRVSGGYIGVDVFFVISGFLITGHLVRELQSTGKLNLGRFWARRAVRLLPASLTVIFATFVAVLILVPDSLRSQFVWEGAASAGYIVNWLLAANSVDYLAADSLASPFQHFWTLSVEEQFYIIVPLILLAAVLVTRRRSARQFGIILGFTAAASLGYGIWLTATTPSVAYFSTFTRAWEFLAGGLLSLVPRTLPRRLVGVGSALGIFGIFVAAFILDESAAFPGWIAGLPVVSTMLVISAGSGSWVNKTARFGPVMWLGNLSYSIYLWHWPLVVLLPYATGGPLKTIDKVSIAIASITLAWVSQRFIENPVRFAVKLRRFRQPRAVFVWMTAAVVTIAAGALGVSTYTTYKIGVADAAARAQLDGGTAPKCYGAAVLDPSNGCPPNPYGTALIPDPAVSGVDVNRAECWTGVDSSEVHVCQLGPESGYTRAMFAVGDSHNSGLIQMYEAMATEMNWRIDLTGHNGCYWSARETDDPNLPRREKCTQWKSNITQWLNDRPAYDAIFTMHASSRSQSVPIGAETKDEATVNGMSKAWSTQTSRGATILAIRDNPVQRSDVKSCIDRHREDPNSCALPRSKALAWFEGSKEAVAATPGAYLIDLTPLLCNSEICPVVIGNAVVYSDRDHLTTEFARSLTPFIERAASAALDR
ncbi:acyltransferase family protein [Propionicimonas sp.]|uniref:acyltransferase family protein n=1 Tax=Propionicimonas sp. TaxID=1955623 RepID=UPI001DD18E8F|nr:acyltransferase family protein [Propionicimonas sp.]MBU3977517.1 acyltransferase [Actinomycetota bacterium]MBU3986027.1 acyltransferase [Actinomycetota bacterium]MBU4008812.1 acyltransferase [Actinomycetota bacterium]MBU4066038.1 acyltransferase [Actinomycetota bacterium]MBU4093486.1 acyltransferase [Actinomycetota bacterium]